MMMRALFLPVLLCFCAVFVHAQNIFSPIPDSLNEVYKYNLKKNFFASDEAFRQFLQAFTARSQQFNKDLQKSSATQNLLNLTKTLGQLEFNFRKMDLYLFLQYATNTTNEKTSLLEDSVYGVMLATRTRYKDYVKALRKEVIDGVVASPFMKEYRYYINSITNNKAHDLSATEAEFLRPFNYLKNGSYYDALTNTAPTDKIYTSTDTLDLFRDMGRWKSHPDSSVRSSGERKLFQSYSTFSNPMGYHYIEMIKGLNAFSRAKKFEGLIDENCYKLSIPDKTLQAYFKEIEDNASFFKTINDSTPSEFRRYGITEATNLLLESFELLGKNYHAAASSLFSPLNGRLDIVGGPNRMRLQGAASVYPIGTSTFFAADYQGFYIDLMVLAHEAGHAVQASLMYGNNVSLLNSSGPGYFTESFGKFNELLVSYHLYETSSGALQKNFYRSKYRERLLGLFGSAEEASIEYHLISGILQGRVATPADLDSTTLLIGSRYRDFGRAPWQKGLWMLLETNFKAPLHNVNDMLASLLAIEYFRQYLQDRQSFTDRYDRFLKNGYTDTPFNLLKQFMNIDLNDKAFCSKAIVFSRAALSVEKN